MARRPDLTDKELADAELIWCLTHYTKRKMEPRSRAVLDPEIPPLTEGFSWLKEARESLFWTTARAGEAAEVSAAAWACAEKNEKTGAITLRQLAKAAAALDCELVYGLRLKSGRSFGQSIWDQVYPRMIEHPWMQACDPHRRAEALAALVRDQIGRIQFRRDKGWTRRAPGRIDRQTR